MFKVPTNRRGRRVWVPDRIFSNEDEKFQAVADQIVEWHSSGVPVLVGTRSIEKSEKLSALLNAAGIEHQILNAKNHEIEAQIVAQAGQPEPSDRRHEHGRPRYRHQARRRRRRSRRLARHRHRASRIATDRPPARRPLRRQGDPGFCQFFVSLEDEIIEAYGEKPAIRLRRRYRDQGELTSNSFRRLVFTAQAKKERQHFRDRKLLMNYEKQRAEMRTQHGAESRVGLSGRTQPSNRARFFNTVSRAVRSPKASSASSTLCPGSCRDRRAVRYF